MALAGQDNSADGGPGAARAASTAPGRREQFDSLRARARHCLTCAREFAAGEELTAVLIEQPRTGNAGTEFLRLSYCAACWPDSPWAQADGPLDEGRTAWPADRYGAAPVAAWTAKAAPPARPRKTFVDDAVLVNFFLRLADSEQPDHRRFRFVLMLILLRHKKLRYDGRDRGAGGAWRVRLSPATAQTAGLDAERVHPVPDPALSDEQVQQVAGQLREILQQDIDQTEGEPT